MTPLSVAWLLSYLCTGTDDIVDLDVAPPVTVNSADTVTVTDLDDTTSSKFLAVMVVNLGT